MSKSKLVIAFITVLAISAAFAQDGDSTSQQPEYTPPQYQCAPPPPPLPPEPPPPPVQHFSTIQRLETIALNTVPGLGSYLIMGDYLGTGIQAYLSVLGVTAIIVYANTYEHPCEEYETISSSNGTRTSCRKHSYSSSTPEYPGLLYIGLGMFSASIAYNIYRSSTYNEPTKSPIQAISNQHSGLSFSILPNHKGEIMPYVMYNKSF